MTIHQSHTLTQIRSGLLLDGLSSSRAIASPPPYGLATSSSLTPFPTSGLVRDQSYIIEARYDSRYKCDNCQWPPIGIVTSVGHSIHLTNDMPMLIVPKNHSHFSQVREISCTPVTDSPPTDSNLVSSTTPPSVPSQVHVPVTTTPQNVCNSALYLNISTDPDDCLTPSYRQLFLSTNEEFQSVLPQKTKSTMANRVQ